MIKLDRLLERFVQSPAGRALAREQLAEDVSARQRLVEEIARLRTEETEVMPPLQAAIAAARGQEESARLALEERRRANAYAIAEEQVASLGYYTRIARLKVQLRATAPEEIGAFLREVDHREDELRRARPHVWAEETFASRIEIERPKVTTTYDEIVAARAEVREIRRAAEAMKLDALAPDDLAERLAALRHRLPDLHAEAAA